MTSPDNFVPGGPNTGWNDVGDLAGALGNQGFLGLLLGGYPNVLQAIFGTVTNPYVEALPIITNHTAQLSEMRDSIDQLTARGRAELFESTGLYYPPEGLVTCRLVGIPAGAGGAAGQWNLLGTNQRGGGGGGGGGYAEIPIAASLFPKTDGVFDPIRIDIFLAGNGGAASEAPGWAGGNIVFGANLAEPYATFQGGVGGMTAGTGVNNGGGGAGGFGMVPGGAGGGGARLDSEGVSIAATPGGSSFASERYMGGGGAGGGGTRGSGTPANGGNSVGTAGGNPGMPGQSPHRAMPVGAGGGGGGYNGQKGGGGGFPGGGGGGGYGGFNTNFIEGGKGGEARLYIFEEMS